ncbi:MAG: polysaccharide deacetylase family protein [Eubacteriales bacterium]|nr:polysaccharide deacetylase family protein [Eubacteriales bacterium]
MMKRLGMILLVIALLLQAFGAAAETEKLSSLPEIFVVEPVREERFSADKKSFLKKETLHTVHPQVDKAIQDIADGYEAELFPQMPSSATPRKNSRMDINTVYYRTGQSWLSTMILARMSHNREQLCSPFTTRTFDLLTGERIMLSDLFAEDSPAWELMSRRVREHLTSIFPNDQPIDGAIDSLCEKSALTQADFTLSAMELTLHYAANQVFEGHPGLIHVRFFYPEFSGMMTEEGQKQTDNSRWKMVAITCDDGPSYAESAKALDAFRAVGARVNYFIVGKKLVNFGDIEMRQFDENHVIACHTYNHWSGYSIKIMANRLKELSMTNDLLYDLSGEGARYFRAPGGTYPPWVECEIGLPIIQWSVDTYDYTGKSPKKIFYSVRNNTTDGDIILMHDSGLQMYKSIPLIADYLLNNGYLMVTLDELAAYQGVMLQPNGVYHRLDDGGMLPS